MTRMESAIRKLIIAHQATSVLTLRLKRKRATVKFTLRRSLAPQVPLCQKKVQIPMELFPSAKDLVRTEKHVIYALQDTTAQVRLQGLLRCAVLESSALKVVNTPKTVHQDTTALHHLVLPLHALRDSTARVQTRS